MSTPASSPESPSHPLRERLAALRARRDELRVKAHLASLDARKAWGGVEDRFTALEGRVESATEGAAIELAHALEEFAKTMTRYGEKLEHAAHDWAHDDAT